ncbi:hypothetical protein TIFTF001_039516 [Ficus carica]|uniref:Uncharacterized protein n=1 Tax=Ficus carica TaxID=3494 RepID=A0AA88JDY7_FICCA|nr:hypothetical protein TIFTF001_039516 [Ficus carica]
MRAQSVHQLSVPKRDRETEKERFKDFSFKRYAFSDLDGKTKEMGKIEILIIWSSLTERSGATGHKIGAIGHKIKGQIGEGEKELEYYDSHQSLQEKNKLYSPTSFGDGYM